MLEVYFLHLVQVLLLLTKTIKIVFANWNKAKTKSKNEMKI